MDVNTDWGRMTVQKFDSGRSLARASKGRTRRRWPRKLRPHIGKGVVRVIAWNIGWPDAVRASQVGESRGWLVAKREGK